LHRMAYLEKADHVIKEGWWKKKGGKGHIDKMAKNRYVVLTDHYLDWYTRPGDKRLGTIPLDSLYVRFHADQESLVIGNQLQKWQRV